MAISENAMKLKEQGNQAFKEHNWRTAISLYTQAIDLYDKEASFYTNRAQVSNVPRDHNLFSAEEAASSMPHMT